MNQIQGGCLCGAIRYTSAAQPLMTAVCHCKHCQRQSGTAFSVLVALPAGTLELQGEAPSTYQDRGESGLAVMRHFCGRCGSPISSQVEAMPGMDWLKAGTLDDASWLQPQVAIWCDHAQPWVPLGETMAKFPKNPPPSA